MSGGGKAQGIPGSRLEVPGGKTMDKLAGFHAQAVLRPVETPEGTTLVPQVALRADGVQGFMTSSVDPPTARALAMTLLTEAARAEYEIDYVAMGLADGMPESILGAVAQLAKFGQEVRLGQIELGEGQKPGIVGKEMPDGTAPVPSSD